MQYFFYRSVEIFYQGETTYKDVDGLLFGTTKDTFNSEDPNSDCYCTNQTKTIEGKQSCYLDGVVDVQNCFCKYHTCKKKCSFSYFAILVSPILLSFPHFLWANEAYLNGVEGMNPNEDIHKTFLLVEPVRSNMLRFLKLESNYRILVLLCKVWNESSSILSYVQLLVSKRL